MYGLTVVESGLVPVYEDSQQKYVVNARELHGFLESGRQFANWIQERIEKYGFSDGADYTSFNKIVKRGTGGGTTRTEYLLTLDSAKEIAMVENNEKGRQVRRYFIACEERLKEIAKHTYPKPRGFEYWQEKYDVAGLLVNIIQEHADVLSDSDKTRLGNCVHNLLTGEDLDAIPAEAMVLYSASELGKMFGVSAYTIGIIANEANLKNSTYGAWVPPTHPDKYNRPSIFKYNKAGKDHIRKLIKDGK